MVTSKKFILIFALLVLCLSGCTDDPNFEDTLSNDSYTETNMQYQENDDAVETAQSQKEVSIKDFEMFDEVEFGGERFNIYKINESQNEIYLLSSRNIAMTTFSDEERSYREQHNYEGSLVEMYVDNFVYDLENKGFQILSSGIIDIDDLYELGFEHSDGLSGLPYEVGDSTPEFVKNESKYWVGGYCKYETRSWTYYDGFLDTEPCEEEFGVRPVIVVSPTDKLVVVKDGKLNIPTQVDVEDLNIREIVADGAGWSSEGGIANPYDTFYFDCENMLFRNVFESSEMSQTCEFKMEFIDNKTIRVEGVMRGHETPAEITIVDANKLRIKFIDLSYNSGNYYLNRNR